MFSVSSVVIIFGGSAVGQKIERDHQRFRKTRPRQGEEQPAEVHQPRRDDRQEGQGPRQHSAAADRRCRSSATARKAPAASARVRARSASRSAPDRVRRAGGAGDQPGGHILEVELSMEEMAAILGEELALPRIEPRGKKNIVTTRDKYTGIRQAGPESLRHFKRTFKRALKRQIAARQPTIPTSRSSSRSARTSSTAAGRKCISRRAWPSSFT